MIKKSLVFIGAFLFGFSDFYTYTIKMNYKEYSSGRVLDKDYTDFGDLIGIGYKFEKFEGRYSYFLKTEFAYGSSYYKGATWGGKPLSTKQEDVYIINFEGGLGLRYFNFILGYREWNRGKSNNPGDYNEKYYWPYFGIRYRYEFYFEKLAFLPEISYQNAISPKIKVELGNQPVLDLGETSGMKVEIPFVFRKDNLYFKVFYRYQYWHINRSDSGLLRINGKVYEIYEPESETINQYLGAGILWKF